jgi:hypothetical protein
VVYCSIGAELIDRITNGEAEEAARERRRESC